MLEEAEKRKEAAVKNRIKGHEKKSRFFFFFKSFTRKMCCSWRSHRAEPGQLSPSLPFLLLPKPPSSERGPGRRPRNRSQKELSSGDLHQGKSRSRGEGGGNVGESRESSPQMQAVPMGLLPAVQAELRPGLEGRSRPELTGWGQREGIPDLSAWVWGNAAHCNALLQLQGLCFPAKPSTTLLWPRLQGPDVHEAPGAWMQVCCIRTCHSQS